MAQSIVGRRRFKFVQRKDDVLFKGEIITKIVEIYLPSLKIFFRTIGPLSTKLGTKHHWVKGTKGFIDKDHLILKIEMMGFFLLLINVMILHSFAQVCMVSHVTMWRKGLLFSNKFDNQKQKQITEVTHDLPLVEGCFILNS